MKLINRRQKSVVRRQKSETTSRIVIARRSLPKQSHSIFCWILLSGISLFGCVTQPSRNYEKSMVTTYAELTLLYEKEKMANKQTDSTYQIKVKEFFDKKGLEQEEFKKEIENISKDSEVWKLFITDVSSAMDSLKLIGN